MFGCCGGENIKIAVEEEQRREPTKNVLSNQLALWETTAYPMGVPGDSTECQRGEREKAGGDITIPSVLCCLLENFQAEGTESRSEKEAVEN